MTDELVIVGRVTVSVVVCLNRRIVFPLIALKSSGTVVQEGQEQVITLLTPNWIEKGAVEVSEEVRHCPAAVTQ